MRQGRERVMELCGRCVQAMINIMTREAREEYDLEELWMKKDRSNVVTYKGVEERRTYTLDELASE